MWQEAAGVLEDGLKLYPGFITAMVALGRAYDHMGQATKARAILEESVKLSPENLRAHRTLIKIYQSLGLNESALQSCAVILSVNPRDEEALIVQSALGGRLNHKKEPPAPAELTASTSTAHIPVDLPASMTAEPESVSPAPFAATTKSMNAAVPTQDQIGGELVGSQTTETVATPPVPSYADSVAQLESWLRRIESRRHDRDPIGTPHHKVS
jgi:tetratricopeptide (TPR) repeat protein